MEFFKDVFKYILLMNSKIVNVYEELVYLPVYGVRIML